MSRLKISASIVMFWAFCGVFAYGATFAHFQREFPSIAERNVNSDRSVAFFMAFTGPIGLAVMTAQTWHDGRPFRHGFMWRLPR